MSARLIQRAPNVGVAEAIRYKRHAVNVSKQALGVEAGFSQSYVGKVERGDCVPSVRAFAKLAVALHMTPLEIYVVLVLESLQPTPAERVRDTPPAYPQAAL